MLRTPIKLLTVPASPTMPSSRLMYPSTELGIVRSHRSETSCTLAPDRSLRRHGVSGLHVGHADGGVARDAHRSSLLLSTTPSPSCLLIDCCRCCSWKSL